MSEHLHELCEIVDRQMEKVVNELRNNGGKLNAADLDYLDKLTHTLKSIKTTEAMEGAEYSGKRDAMGRFTRDGYAMDSYARESRNSYGESRNSYNDGREQLERLMNSTTDERTRRAIHKALNEM